MNINASKYKLSSDKRTLQYLQNIVNTVNALNDKDITKLSNKNLKDLTDYVSRQYDTSFIEGRDSYEAFAAFIVYSGVAFEYNVNNSGKRIFDVLRDTYFEVTTKIFNDCVQEKAKNLNR